ncbi:MAG: hypothetical protein ING36_00245 [Burkholderiales bacterium]|nr:hypothetical protein [Burkholderiales bacterium]
MGPSSRPIHCSMAAFPGMSHLDAVKLAIARQATGQLEESALGLISLGHVQLVPQNRGCIDPCLASGLREAYPHIQFRLHANVRVSDRWAIYDLAGFKLLHSHFVEAARIHALLGATAYSAHSGRRDQATLPELFDYARRAADLFNSPVAIEGQYPTAHNEYLISSWQEYQTLFESGVPYALDLSHLNIVAQQTGETWTTLVREMLSSDRCLEVHLSDNDGTGDHHQRLNRQPWWFDLLKDINPDAVLFTEGNHLFQRKGNGYGNSTP